ncbi:MAG: hypothetical protein PHQ35_11310 [Phycisphaerae bacterium]|nr:hypothetical protein [Phycisphaerae bacterium]
MRKQLLKLKKGISTKAERRFAEVLKRGRIPFKAKIIVKGREVDFLIGKYAIDIDGHQQSGDKNVHLMNAGYIPLHFSNLEILTFDRELLTNKLKNLCH